METKGTKTDAALESAGRVLLALLVVGAGLLLVNVLLWALYTGGGAS